MNNYYPKYLIIIITLLFCVKINGQSDKDLGSWNGLGIKYDFNNKFSLTADSRLRGYEFYNNFYYYEATLKASYNINNIFTVSVGGGKHINHPKNGNFLRPLDKSEIRFYQEIVGKNSFSRFFFDHRIRTEQRFISTGYENRFRYRIGSLIPLNNTQIVPKTFLISVWEEVFISDYKPYLTLNRFFAGVNYKMEYVTFQTGIVNQMNNDNSVKTFKNFFLVTLLFEFKRKIEK
jgi:hypothetical protein